MLSIPVFQKYLRHWVYNFFQGMKKLKQGITMRGDSLYCPLSLSLDSYGNCLTDCYHCYFRNLNKVWGEDLKPLDVENFEKKLISGLKNQKPKTPLAYALNNKKTIRWGNKTDPFQLVEKDYGIAHRVFSILKKLEWSFVIQTRFTHVLEFYQSFIFDCKNLVTIMPVVSPGLGKDWELFERKRTTLPIERIKYIARLKRKGIKVGVNGEPFIPGFHTVKDFEKTLKVLINHNIYQYNTYNFHFNAFVAKRLVNLPGVDIEKIWFYNQDNQWRLILGKLIDLAEKYGVKLGCPDFVNSGKNYIEPFNTCCGIDVQNPCKFNTHFFKKYKQQGCNINQIIDCTYDGTGDLEEGVSIINGKNSKRFTLNDIK